MAEPKPNIIGRAERGGFETVGRRQSWAEQRVSTATVVGKVEDVFDKAKPGDSMANHAAWFGNKFNPNYYVRTVEESSDDGVMATVSLTLVKCPQGKTKPYNVTWEVGMEEVQMKLINHPLVLENCDIDKLLMWEDTQKGRRVEKDKDGKLTFFYDEYDYSGGAGVIINRQKITGEWDIAYCKAVTQGIETFNRYLPVITKNSSFLEMPGANYSQDHIVTGGTISDFTGSDTIGHYDAPDLKVAGFIDGKDGVWFKNLDRYTINADGTATRTEGWVFTNDPSAKWIYTGNLDN